MKNVLMMVVTAMLFTSCATMFSGTSYTANVTATKPDSEIFINGKSKGTGDVTVRQKRRHKMEIEVVSGDKTTEYTVQKSIKWGSQVANLLNWWSFIPIGTIIDLASGGIWQPEHKHVPEVTKVNNKEFNIKIKN